jgi:hypothetical protein
MYALVMVLLFYSTSGVSTATVTHDYSSKSNCEAAVKDNSDALRKNGEEGKIVLATCTAK